MRLSRLLCALTGLILFAFVANADEMPSAEEVWTRSQEAAKNAAPFSIDGRATGQITVTADDSAKSSLEKRVELTVAMSSITTRDGTQRASTDIRFEFTMKDPDGVVTIPATLSTRRIGDSCFMRTSNFLQETQWQETECMSEEAETFLEQSLRPTAVSLTTVVDGVNEIPVYDVEFTVDREGVAKFFAVLAGRFAAGGGDDFPALLAAVQTSGHLLVERGTLLPRRTTAELRIDQFKIGGTSISALMEMTEDWRDYGKPVVIEAPEVPPSPAPVEIPEDVR